MHYSAIKKADIANGFGVRVSLFVSGCTRHCKNCFNQETWDFNHGDEFTDEVVDDIINELKHDWYNGLTILGGEPMEPQNQKAVLDFILKVRKELPEEKTIWLYTGNVLEKDILKENGRAHTEYSDDILRNIDILIDGPFIEEKKDISLLYRGSSNQRVIDARRTMEYGYTCCVKLYNDGRVAEFKEDK